MSNLTLGVTVDIPIFIISTLQGQVSTASNVILGNTAITAYYPQQGYQQPSVSVLKATESWAWISIPAERRRHYTYLLCDMWATNYPDLYSMSITVRSAITTTAALHATRFSYANFVWMQIVDEREKDDPTTVPPVYRRTYTIEVIWDELTPVPT